MVYYGPKAQNDWRHLGLSQVAVHRNCHFLARLYVRARYC